MSRVDLAVVGGGITGLAAAWEAHRRGATVVLLEAEPAAGGKLRTTPVAGVPLDESADAFLARVPEAVELCRELGIDGELVSPASPSRAYVFARGELRPLPDQQLLGVPTDLDALAATGLVSAAGIDRAREDLDRPDDRPDDDTDEAVAALVRRRLGDEVLDTLVAPLVGGIWAGDCDRLSLATATPGLLDARRRGPSLIRSAATIRAQAARTDTPVFYAPQGGMTQLVDALVEALGTTIRAGRPVAGIEPDRGAWRIEPHGIVADAVVVATPAPAAAPLVEPHSAPAGATLAGIEHASVVLVALAVPRAGIDRPLDGSGFLVPHGSGLLLTACSWSLSKWPHLAPGDGDTVLLRASAGRDGDDRILRMDDATLVETLLADLRTTMDLHSPPTEVRISRWERSFPQPRPGHLDRVARLEAALATDAPGLVAAGAWARGVGIPACIRAGRRGAATALHVRTSSPP